jgi:predicted secreted protein
MQKLELGEIDNGKTIDIDRGSLILIRLPESGATGYIWKVNAVDAQVITLQDSKFQIDAGTGVGGGGVITFVFKAQSPGTTILSLHLARPWDKEDVIKRFEVTLHVK